MSTGSENALPKSILNALAERVAMHIAYAEMDRVIAFLAGKTSRMKT